MSIDIDKIPKKPRYRLNEVCEFTDTQPYVLRFWESEFDQFRPEKGKGGQPIFRRADLELILRIKELLYDQELNIADARAVLDGESPVPRAVARPEPVEEGEPEPSRDVVQRARYEDAIEEIGTLRLRVEELERDLRAARRAKSPLAGDAWPRIRDRVAAIADRLDAN